MDDFKGALTRWIGADLGHPEHLEPAMDRLFREFTPRLRLKEPFKLRVLGIGVPLHLLVLKNERVL